MPATPASDLRSEGKSFQRDRNHANKWARGGNSAPGKPCQHRTWPFEDSCHDCVTRPLARDYARRCGRHFNLHNANAKEHADKLSVARKAFRNEVLEATDAPVVHNSDASSDEEVYEPSAAPLPDVDVMYSFDAPSGPRAGSDILSQALNKAVERFESKETDKLIKNEYDLVLDGKDEPEARVPDADDDFELVDASYLK